MLLQSLIVVAAVLAILRNLFLTWANINRFPKSIPWTSRRNEYFSRIRACGREVFRGLESMKAGYEQVSAFFLRMQSQSVIAELLLVLQAGAMLHTAGSWTPAPGDGTSRTCKMGYRAAREHSHRS